jgi:hypothetical protein
MFSCNVWSASMRRWFSTIRRSTMPRASVHDDSPISEHEINRRISASENPSHFALTMNSSLLTSPAS